MTYKELVLYFVVFSGLLLKILDLKSTLLKVEKQG